jgi:hypothetical protein
VVDVEVMSSDVGIPSCVALTACLELRQNGTRVLDERFFARGLPQFRIDGRYDIPHIYSNATQHPGMLDQA